MKYGLAALVLCAPVAAAADTLVEVPAHGPPVPASQVVETACEVEVDVRAGLAVVELRQHLQNSGPAPVAAGYELAIPAGAALIGATLRDGSAPEAGALAVPMGFATAMAHDGDAVGVDPVLVVQIPGDADGRAHYHATLQPIEPTAPPFGGAASGGQAPVGGVQHAVVLTTRWAMPVTVDAGALHVVLPGRESGGTLPACRGTAHAVSGPGATVSHMRAGKTTSTGATVTFSLDDAELPLAAELAFARAEPVVWTQREALGGGFAAQLVTVLAPPARARLPLARRAMFVIDGSRSMDMIGPAAVARVVDAVAAALAPGTQLDAIVYDRTATRVLGGWQPAERAVGPIAEAIAKHVATNGSDLAAALRIAHEAVADGASEMEPASERSRGGDVETAVIIITDGVLGQLPDTALVDALAATSSAVDVHAIVIDPGAARTPGKALLARPVSLYGGSYVEVSADTLDASLAGVDDWVRPAWVETALHGVPATAHGELPNPLRAGGGATWLYVTHGTPAVAFDAKSDAPVHATGKPAPAGGEALGALALAQSDAEDFSLGGTAAEHVPAARVREQAILTHPIADAAHALAVVAAAGKVAHDRRAMIAGGGPYTRIATVEEAGWTLAAAHARPGAPPPTAIDRTTLERLFRDQLQPAAYVCYERALTTQPKLAGTVHYTIDLGRGEVSRVHVEGLGDAAFDACLADAAYRMAPPMPDLRVNSDDETLVHYPLTFGLADRHPTIVAGDADSAQPLDIDAIEGGAPALGKPGAIHVDTETPLGTLKPR